MGASNAWASIYSDRARWRERHRKDSDGVQLNWREQYVADFGVDAHIEVVVDDYKPTGKLFGVQVKTGPSYFRGTGETIHFYATKSI